MTRASFAVLPLVLAACGVDSDGMNLQDDDQGQGGRCSTAYYAELRGNYEGTIEYFGPASACAWRVAMQLSTQPQTIGTCATFVSMTSDLISSDFGDNTRCGDVGISARLDEPYLSVTSSQTLNNPIWPVEGSLTLNQPLDADRIFPVGDTGVVQVMVLHFDGNGTVSYPDNNRADERFEGVLIR